MYERLSDVTLKSGEVVEAGVVRGPDADWADRVEDLLSHKGQVWNWQNAECLRRDLGIDVGYYVLHRDGLPFANILTATHRGVGHFGHVFTRPADRRQGAASALMGLQMADFRARDGRALYLGTGFDSAPYHIYRRHGFEGLEPGSGLMDHYPGSSQAFTADWFAPGPVRIVGTGWTHWPASAPLFTADLPGAVRWAGHGLLGRATTEGTWLEVLHGDPTRIRVLEQTDTGAVVGAAAWVPHPTWPHTCLLDVWCHPEFWDHGADLAAALELPSTQRCIAYSDDTCSPRSDVLAALGFRSLATFRGRVAVDTVGQVRADVTEWERA